MPRVVPNVQYVINQLRIIAGSKKAAPATRLRACDRVIALEAFVKNPAPPPPTPLYTVQMKDAEPDSGKPPEEIGVTLDPEIEAMVQKIVSRRTDGDKLSNNQPSGS